jgi:hypothetical protein
MVMVISAMLPAFGMEVALKEAIQKSDVQKVQTLLQQLKNTDSAEPSTPLLRSPQRKIDLDPLHQLAQQLLQEKIESKDTLNNIDVYKRVIRGLATLGIGIGGIGYYFYQSSANGHSGSITDFLGVIVTGCTLFGHAADQILLGIGNTDANNAHTSHLSITHLINEAKQPEEPA